jgi:chromate transporter
MASFFGANELLVLFGIGVLAAVSCASSAKPGATVAGFVPLATSATAAGSVAVVAATPFSLGTMFLFFLKVGSVLFGSGYVLLAFLRADLVERWGWLTESQLLDAIAVGQFTPGPLFTTATFIGYLLAGTRGAALATVGIFLPAFVFVALSGPLIPRVRRSPIAGAFLDGVNVASLALMAVVTWQLGRAAVCDWLTAVLALACTGLLLRFRVNSAWLVLGGACVGILRGLL